MRSLKIAVATAALAVAGFSLAAQANADDSPPAPSGSDTSSYGSMGGLSLGMDGYSLSMGDTTLTSSGWPISRTTFVGPGFNYDATTDYNSKNEGSIEDWSKLDSPMLSFDNHGETYYDGTSSRTVDVTLGGNTMHFVCTGFLMCQMQ